MWKTKKDPKIVGPECIDREKKEEIMRKKNKLKGCNIYIENDKTWKEKKKKRKLRAWAKWKENKDEIEEKRKFGYNKAWIGGEEWRLNERTGEIKGSWKKRVEVEEEMDIEIEAEGGKQ